MTNSELYDRTVKKDTGIITKEWWVRVWSPCGTQFKDMLYDDYLKRPILTRLEDFA